MINDGSILQLQDGLTLYSIDKLLDQDFQMLTSGNRAMLNFS